MLKGLGPSFAACRWDGTGGSCHCPVGQGPLVQNSIGIPSTSSEEMDMEWGGGVPGHLRHAGDTCVLDRLLEQARKITPSSCNMTQWPAPSTRENAWILGTLMTRARKGGHKCQIFTSSPPLGLCPSPGGGQVKPAAQDGLCILDKNWKNMDKAKKPRLQICTHDPSSQGSSELGNPTGF